MDVIMNILIGVGLVYFVFFLIAFISAVKK